MASSTWPGPTGSPLCRSRRAKCMMLSASRPSGGAEPGMAPAVSAIVGVRSAASALRSLRCRQDLAQRAAQPIELVEQVENDVDAGLVDAEPVLQVSDEVGARHVDLGEALIVVAALRQEPALGHPHFQGFGPERCAHQKFACLHGSRLRFAPGILTLALPPPGHE